MFDLSLPTEDGQIEVLVDEESAHVRYCGLLKDGYAIAYRPSDLKRFVIDEETSNVVGEVPGLCAHLFETPKEAGRFLSKNNLEAYFEVNPMFFTDLEEYDGTEEEDSVDHIECPSCGEGPIIAERQLFESGKLTGGDYVEPGVGDPYYRDIEVDVDSVRCRRISIECSECSTTFV